MLYINHIFDHHNRRLTTLNQSWLSPNFLEQYCQIIHNSGAPLQNCWGFVDGTLENTCRPGEFQRLLFNGQKRVHAVKFQSVVILNGLIANLFGPIEGRKHDAAVGWVFADIKNYFAFLDFKKKLKIGLSAIGKMYSACALLHNARTCLYGNLTSSHFDIHPPELRDYFQ